MKFLFFSFCILFSIQYALALSSQEQDMVHFIEQHAQPAEELLEKTVNINSGTMNLEGVKEVGVVFKQELDALGFSTRWIPMPKAMNRAGHLFATIGKSDKNRILLIGHLDTVFEPSSPFQKFKRLGDRASGPGVSDMKGGIVAMIFAFKAMKHLGVLDRMNLTVALIGDEEDVGLPQSVSRKDLVSAAKKSRYALAFESSGKEMKHIAVSRRGYAKWALTVEGVQGHASQIFTPKMGDGAAFETARILSKFREQIGSMEYLTLNPGLVASGTSIQPVPNFFQVVLEGRSNIIAPKSLVHGDLRTTSEKQYQDATKAMREIVKSSLPQTTSSISFDNLVPPMEASEGNHRVAALVSQVSQDLGIGEVAPEHLLQRGAADISFVAKYVDGVDGMGVLGFDEHSPDEQIDLKSLPKASSRAAITMLRLFDSRAP